MPRLARAVLPGVAHHLTQRGVDRRDVFFSDANREVYLQLAALSFETFQVRALAYCLMSNHVHGNAISYDAESRQTGVNGSGVAESYFYDGDGKRVEKMGGGITTVYVYDAAGELAAEYSTAASSSPCKTCYLSADHLGTPRLITDGQGNVIGRHDYLPFGEEIGWNGQFAGRTSQWGPGNDSVSQEFTGKERDSESGLDWLHYFGARYYGSALGRFTSPDPLFFQKEMLADPQNLNLYAYVRSNPLTLVDPTGEKIRLIFQDEADRADEIAKLQAAVGPNATVGYVQDAKGDYYVTITGDTSSGPAKDFAWIASPDQETVNFRLVNDEDHVLLNDAALIDSGAVGATYRDDKDGQLWVNVKRGEIINVDGWKFGSSWTEKFARAIFPPAWGPYMWRVFNGVPADGVTETGHEFGHGLYLMRAKKNLVPRTADGSDKSALDLENKVRQLRKPGSPKREVH